MSNAEVAVGRGRVWLVVALSAALLGGCGSSGSTASHATTSHASTPVSSGAGATAAVNAVGGGTPVDAAAFFDDAAKAEKSAGSAKVALTVQPITATGTRGLGETGTGLVRWSSDGISLQLELNASKLETFRVVLLPGKVYVAMPSKTQGKTWVRVSAGGTDPISKSLSSLLDLGSRSGDPMSLLRSLGSGITVNKIGPVQQDGATLTRYHVAIPTSLLLKALSPTVRMAAGSQLSNASMDTDCYLDGQGRLARMVSTERVRGRTIVTTESFSDWGTAAMIDEPPASDVLTLS